MPRKARVDRARVLAVAADLAERDGFAAVTLPAVAAALAIRVPSLYNHVTGLEDIRRGIVLLALERFTGALRDAAIGRAGDEAVRTLADAYRAFAHAHPGWYAAIQAAGAYADEAVKAAASAPVAVAVAVLAAYDLHDDDALHAVRALRSVLHGFVALELGGGFGLRSTATPVTTG
jgi:AcrR family transcriptional regulator